MKISPINYAYNFKKPAFTSSNWVSGAKSGNFLIHETAFFRESDTDEFVKKYLTENFLSKNIPIKIMVGACSSGEETYSQAMLYDEFGALVDILGFDVSQKAVDISKEGLYQINKNNSKRSDDDSCAYKDSYLCYGDSTEISRRQKRYREYFNNYFIEYQKSETTTLESVCSVPITCREQKHFKIRDEKRGNCRFEQGDILNLSSLSCDNQAHVIFFRNAMYHLVCDFALGSNSRGAKKNSEETIRKIAQEMNKKLVSGGLVVFGENEKKEGVNVKDVYRIMKEEGFEPLNAQHRIDKEKIKHPYSYSFDESEYTNVWRKI